MSQLELAMQAEISTRHLSFVETGRAKPSRDMILHLAEQLDLTLRERNSLLVAAGFAPVYAETPLDSPHMSGVRDAVRRILAAHEPYPALAFDRKWNVVEANRGIGIFTATVAPSLLASPMNVLRASLHPEGLAPHIVNLREWRAHLLSRLRRQVEMTADTELEELYAELCAYPCADAGHENESAAKGAIAVPLRLRRNGNELTFLSTVTSFGTPLDITIAELAIESFFPADALTVASIKDSCS